MIVKRHSQVEEEEGCLSFPGLYGTVRRARKVRIQADDLDGIPFEVEAEDLFSRAVQHESDHLDGRLFIDFLDTEDREATAEKIEEFEKAHREAQASGTLANDATLRLRLEELARDA